MERILLRSHREGECLIFEGGSRNGSRGQYRRIMIDTRLVSVHRYVYEALVGPIPDGMTVDHTCGHQRCVNVAHLRVLTSGDNVRAYWHEQAVLCRNGLHRLDQTARMVTHRGRPSKQCGACYDAKRRQ